MLINLNDIFGKCQGISSFEGRRLTDGEGKSLYPIVHIEEQDKDLIKSYLVKALSLLEGDLQHVVDHIEYDDDDEGQYEMVFINDEYINIPDKQIEETLSAYIMQLWLADKSEQRSQAYQIIYASMVTALKKAMRKKRPTFKSTY